MRRQCNPNVRKQQQISAVLRLQLLFQLSLRQVSIFLYAQNVVKNVRGSLLRMRR